MIIIIDYGMGNLGSILNMLKKVGAKAKVSANITDIHEADKLILPGVGAFDTGMKNLAELGLIDVLNEQVLDHKIPTLGVCLGMQLLTKSSEEGELPGLGWIDSQTVRFNFTEEHSSNLKIPHMGWNTVKVHRTGTLFHGLDDDARFYFVHSYHVVCHDPTDILTTTDHGYDFVSAVQRGNIMGAQFHPEKSHKFGLRLFKNFVELT
ncbi:MAG: imidazole glycerol phosphate synthase subunit HisH [Anaerolineae bacterium]|nr:imidazole glycerol phosphate synthase subunit HisH [Anaerolineae bacterium]